MQGWQAKIARAAEQASVAAAETLAQGATEPLVLNTMPVAADRIVEVPTNFATGLPVQTLGDTGLIYAPRLPAYAVLALGVVAAPAVDGLSIDVTDAGAVGKGPARARSMGMPPAATAGNSLKQSSPASSPCARK